MKFDKTHLKEYLSLYLVSDRYWLCGRELKEDILRAVEGGVSFVQLREKACDQETFLQEAKQIKYLCEQYEIPFVINDDVELARLVDADGVHVGQQDENARHARIRLGEDKIIGVSVQTVEAALQAQSDGADYLGVGAVFSTATKKDADDVTYDTLQAICKAVTIPVIAIGGITKENVHSLKGSGICGIAVVSAILAKENIYQAAKELKQKCEMLWT